jgi:hypothetical protein
MTDNLEETAQEIAERGRDALLARLRPAFKEAAAEHGDALSFDDEQLEEMVQRAADNADGLQWRRALAGVATEQLGIGLGEALGHPAVERAQAIVGAPSYEEALAALGQAPAPAAEERKPEPAAEAADAEPIAEESDEEPVRGDSEEEPAAEEPAEEEPAEEPEPEPEPDEAAEPEEEAEPEAQAEPETKPETAIPTDDRSLRVRAVHLGGIANLAPAEGDLELHISDVGLDIVRGPDQSVLGRLTWKEIIALETPEVSGRFRRKKPADAHLVVRSHQGSASFEIPGISGPELREHLTPLLEHHTSAGT